MKSCRLAQGLLWSQLVLLAALCLALGSEALQFFATDRHPRWLDVGIDMAGAVVGWGVVRWHGLPRRWRASP
jgi:VanZ family protein